MGRKLSFHDIEYSMRQFLIDEQQDHYNSTRANVAKYNNLKVSMDPKKEPTPHLMVRIGISEGYFALDEAKVISGGLGSDTRYVIRWMRRNFQRYDFKTMWEEANKTETVDLNVDN